MIDWVLILVYSWLHLKKQSQFVMPNRMKQRIRKEYRHVVKIANNQSSLVNNPLNISL
jgi:hypothetical protein